MGESADIIDYTLLQKKGILRRAQQRVEQGHGSSRETVASNPLASFLPSAPAPSSEGGLFGFLDASSSSPSPPSSSSLPPSDLSALAIKVDDLDYKLNKLAEQLALLEAKMGFVQSTS